MLISILGTFGSEFATLIIRSFLLFMISSICDAFNLSYDRLLIKKINNYQKKTMNATSIN